MPVEFLGVEDGADVVGTLQQAADFKPYKEATRTVGEQGSPTTGMAPRTPPARPTPPLGQPQP